MKETSFIEQNRKKWKEFEEIVESPQKDPERMSQLFIQLTDDLSYARTFYPNRTVRLYLNNLAQKIFQSTYKNRKQNWSVFLDFWTEELPQVVYSCRKPLLLSLVVFLLAVAIGVISSVHDPDFCATILGDSYVEMTKRNIESGDPMAVYKQKGETDMFLGISLNNVRVAFMCFLSGLFFSVGSLAVMLFNGIMVGTFQYFFIEKGVFWESFLTIWLHGTLEMSAIVIAGGAGMVLGSGLVFPGTLSRSQSFQVSAKKGLKILLGIVPIIVFAAFVEGFFTRFTEAPDALRLIFILGSLGFILWYFVWLPYSRYAKNGVAVMAFEENLPVRNTAPLVKVGNIRTGSEVVADVFLMLKKNFRKILSAILIGIGLYAPLFYLYESNFAVEPAYFPTVFMAMYKSFNYGNSIQLHFLVLNFLFLSGLTAYFGMLMIKEVPGKETTELKGLFRPTLLLQAMIFSAILTLALMASYPYFILIYLFLMPLVYLWTAIGIQNRLSPVKALAQTFRILKSNKFKVFEVSSLTFFIGVLMVLLVSSPLLLFYTDSISWSFVDAENISESVKTLLHLCTGLLAIGLFLGVAHFSFHFASFSFKEIIEAEGLQQKIDDLF